MVEAGVQGRPVSDVPSPHTQSQVCVSSAPGSLKTDVNVTVVPSFVAAGPLGVTPWGATLRTVSAKLRVVQETGATSSHETSCTVNAAMSSWYSRNDVFA